MSNQNLRIEISDALCQLSLGQFEGVLFRLGPSTFSRISPATVPQAIRATEVVEWADQSGEGLRHLERIIEEVKRHPSERNGGILDSLENLPWRQFNFLLSQLKIPTSRLPGMAASQDSRAIHLLLLYEQSHSDFSLLEEAITRVQQRPRNFPPSLEERFYGRDKQLEEIRELLDSNKSVLLSGLAGVGKSRLAIEFTWTYEADFPGGVFWVSANGRKSRDEQFYQILQELVPDTLPLNELLKQGDDLSLRLERELRPVLSERRMLWILDDLLEYVPGRPETELSYWCPVWDKALMLITSSSLVIAPRELARVDVLPLARDASIKFLSGNARKALTPEQANQISEWVGDLPLALELINSSLAYSDLTLEELIELSRAGVTEELDDLMNELRPYVQENALRGVTETFRLSYEHLPSDAQKSARLLAQLSTEQIPRSLILSMRAVVPRRARTALVNSNFVTQGTGESFGVIHRVLADFIRKITPEPEAERKEAGGFILSLFSSDKCCNPKEWSVLNTYTPHAVAVFERATRLTEEDIKLGILLGELYRAQGRFVDACAIEEICKDQATAILGAEHCLTLTATHNLAASFYERGYIEHALKLQKQIREAHERLHGLHHRETLIGLSNLAATLHAQGEFAEALELQQLVLNINREMQGSEHRDTLRSMSDLAATYFAQGQLGQALELQEQAAEVSRRIYGADDPEALVYQSNFAEMLIEQGDLGAAYDVQNRVLEISRATLGEEHPDTLRITNNFARTMFLQKRFIDGQKLEEYVVEKSSLIMGERHPHTLKSMNTLAQFYFAQGNFKEAQRLYERIMEISRVELGEVHDETLASMRLLAATLKAQGKFESASQLEQRLLEINRDKLEEGSPEVLKSENELAHTLFYLGEVGAAQILLRQAWEVSRRFLGDDDPITTTLRDNYEALSSND